MALTLGFGPIGIQWQIEEQDPGWAPFRTAYAPFLSRDAATLVVEAEILPVADAALRPWLPTSFIRLQKVYGHDFDLGDGLIRGTLPRTDLCRCAIHPVLLAGTGLRVLEQFFYLLFHHATLRLGDDPRRAPLLLHSSALVEGGDGYVFSGPPGSGKSTVAALSRARPLLGDEATVLVPDGDGWRAEASPINPFCPDKTPGAAPLRRLLLLEQAERHEVHEVSAAEAVPFLCAEIIAPLALLETDLQTGLARALDRAIRLYRSGCVRRLCFRRDAGFWDELRD